MRRTGKCFLCCAGIVFYGILNLEALAQSITLTSPTTAKSYSDTPEFATTVVGNSWDMNELRDIAFDVHFSQPSVSSGIWTGTALESSFYFLPLFGGYSTTSYETYPSYYDNGTPYGPLNPVDASKYDRISIRYSLAKSSRSVIGIYWSEDHQVSPLSVDTSNGGYIVFRDSEYGVTSEVFYESGYRILDIDLTSNTLSSELDAGMFDPLSGNYSGSWNNYIYSLLVMPSRDKGAGTAVSVDWIRLYDSSSSPTLNVTWTTSGTTAYDHVRVFVDSNNSGFDGDMIATGLTNDGSYTLRPGALPPGEYYIYLELVRRNNTSIDYQARSAYSGKITIKAAPSLVFTAPSYTSGVDYAETVLGNAWNMDSSDELRASYDLASASYSSGQLVATTSSGESDSQLWMNTRSKGRVLPIVADDFRYATFRMKVETTGYTNIYDRIERGWVTRLIWCGTDSLDKYGSYSKDIPLLEDWHTYSVDLWDSSLLESNNLITTSAQLGWLNTDTISLFRLDPLEVPQSTQFTLDYIKVNAMNKTENNSYTIRWTSADTDSSSATITLEYGTVDSYGNFSKSGDIATLSSQSFGSGSTTWDASGVTAGDYYIRAKVNDGTHTLERVSKVPVRVEATETETSPIWAFQWGWPSAITVPGDYDGDGISDMAVFDSNSGGWYITTTKNEILAWGVAWGWPGATPVEGDYDADGRSDLAVFDTNGGNWYVYSLRGDILYWGFTWGWSTAVPVPGDYDNDGKSDFAVFDSNSGYWYSATSSGQGGIWAFQWGWPGAVPVPGDYNGDQISDYAVFDSNTGYWYIISSEGTVLAWEIGWGWPGAEPVPGDYDDDGIADLTIYDQNTGYWFVYSISQGVLTWYQQWGWPGAEVVHGTYVGDESDDFAVMDSNTGYWYVLEN